MKIDFEKELNQQQYLAATSNAQYLRIVAGAGTGKTRTLTFRLAHLILRGDIDPRQIVAITFTNKAAKEMRERTVKLISSYDIEVPGLPLIMTFHSFCLLFLRRELVNHYTGFNQNFTIADEDDQKDYFKKIADEMKYTPSSTEFKEYINMVHHAKTEGKKVEDLVLDLDNPKNVYVKIFQRYQELLAEANQLDFDDILIFTKEILTKDEACRNFYQRRFKVFMIDEFQDTNNIQYDIVKKFMNEECELCVVGDPDQTIYTWRGANNDLIKNKLKRDFPSLETVTLDINYRSSQQILNIANKLIANNTDREEKNLKAFNNRQGEEVEVISSLSQDEEANFIARKIKSLHVHDDVKYSDIAIIYRSNFLSRSFEKAFPKFSIPYEIYGSKGFYQREEVKSGLAYLRILVNDADELSLLRVFKYPRRNIGEKTLDSLRQQASLKNKTLIKYIMEDYEQIVATNKVKENLTSLALAYNECFKIVSLDDVEPKKIVDSIAEYFKKVGLFEYFDKVDEENLSKGSTGDSKVDNLKELLNALKEYLNSSFQDDNLETPCSLIGFLLNVALLSDQDQLNQEDHVLLMTGHISKGLEFPYVFISGMVEGYFPSSHALEDSKHRAIQEERRLCYVMMTKAKKKLFLSYFGGRNFSNDLNLPSSFLKEAGFNLKPKISFYSTYKTDRSIYNQIDSLYSSINKNLDNFGYDPYYQNKPVKKINSPSRLVSSNVSNSQEVYNIGDKIAHVSYGVGEVISQNERFIEVDFKNEHGVKKLAKGFKAFKKVSK